ncbi:hypothetical protein CEXT_673931 [Caerostris extrusa]|uniref:Uncharacterized protein n=1 Tax=Caerostris extrusa TaxID=172846 RepID=A0AAV4XCJ3_CAEEX|nr:hypothetical protein CEXT_673931 [Caerostris extrusa]
MATTPDIDSEYHLELRYSILKPKVNSSKFYESVCNQHKSVLEHTRSFPPLSQWLSRNDEDLPKIKIDYKTKIKSPVPQIGTDEELNRSSEDHPYLRRQEAVEEDPSDDSSSETTVLLGRQTPATCSRARRPSGKLSPKSDFPGSYNQLLLQEKCIFYDFFMDLVAWSL